MPDADVDFTYDDAMDLNFRIVNQADLYTRSEDGATWTDRSSDEAYMKNLVDQGLELHVVGVVRPKGTASATSLGEGIAYRHDLITHLMAEAADSEIVRAQLANPDVDVFTGKTFDELQDAQNAQLDMSSLFSVDESKIAQAFTIDQSALTADGIDASAFDFSNIDMGSVTASATPNKEEIAKSVMSTLATNMPAPDFADLGYGDLAEPLSKMGINSLSDLASISDAKANPTMMTILQQYPEVAGRLASLGAVADAYRKQVDLENTNSLFKGYLQYVKDHGSEGKSYSQMMSDYLVGDGKAALDAIVAVAGDNGEATRAGMTKYLTNTVAPSISAALATAQATATSQATEQMMTGMQQQLAQVIAQQMTDVMGQQMARFAMFASAISVNMDQDDLTSLLVNYMNREELTYDNNLIKLGYADEDKPESINIYAKSFDDKQVVEDIIADYNDQVEAAGDRLRVGVARRELDHDRHHHLHQRARAQERDRHPPRDGREQAQRGQHLQRGDLHRGTACGYACHRRGVYRVGAGQRHGPARPQRGQHPRVAAWAGADPHPDLGCADAGRGPDPVDRRRPP